MRRIFAALHLWHRMPNRLRITNKDRILFAKRLSLYLRAGISIVEALNLIQATPGTAHHARLLRYVSLEVQRGVPLSIALTPFERAYPKTYIQLIAVGETSGTLPQALSYLTQLLELRASRSRAILGALAYPVILFVGSLGISLFLLAYVFPKIIPLFRGLNAELPFTTRVLLNASYFLQDYWILLLGCGCVFVIAISSGLQSYSIKRRMHSFLLRLPFFGKLIRSTVLASLFRIIATLLSSGVRLDEALRMARESTSYIPYSSAITHIRNSVLAGGKFSIALKSEPFLFPAVAFQLISAGEMTGTLSESATSTAQIFDEELAEGVSILSASLEPIIMIVMGFVIGFIALAIISPMYGITQSLSA